MKTEHTDSPVYSWTCEALMVTVVDACEPWVSAPYDARPVTPPQSAGVASADKSEPGVWCTDGGLSAGEVDVLNLLHECPTYMDIARRLVISRRTVENRVQSIFSKTDIHRKHLLLEWWRRKKRPEAQK